jgi:hypothetical protein
VPPPNKIVRASRRPAPPPDAGRASGLGIPVSTCALAAVAELWRCVDMRLLCLLFLAVLHAGCGQHEDRARERAALDALLTSGRVKQVEFVDRRHDKTNIYVAEGALEILDLFSATNRVELPPPDTKHYSDWIFLIGDNAPVRLQYFPRQQALSYRGYRFALRGTNDIHRYFE